MQQALSNVTQEKLRKVQLITETEVAFSIGDKHIAENILTKTRREIHIPRSLLENTSNKRELKG